LARCARRRTRTDANKRSSLRHRILLRWGEVVLEDITVTGLPVTLTA
jgi:hypothetical protein